MARTALHQIPVGTHFKPPDGGIYRRTSATKDGKLGATDMDGKQAFFKRDAEVTAIDNPRDDPR